ncbi:hypothetical protein BGZ54_004582 [Gamsiella multidivaricata]|nr:hypothetical protein BGZ54_004582 [Gamsiella multidivaricata]
MAACIIETASAPVHHQELSDEAIKALLSSTTSGAATGTPSGTVTSPATGTPSGTIIGTATGTATAPAPTVSRSPQDPVSSLTMLNPKANLQNPPLFPIGVDIDFAWDYDKYLKLQPTNLTIEAFMTNSPTTIITLGAALPGNLKNYTWTAANQKNITHPIQTAMYTLRIFDGAVGRSGSLPQGGYLITYSGLKFGLYAPNTYTPGSQMNRKATLSYTINYIFFDDLFRPA